MHHHYLWHSTCQVRLWGSKAQWQMVWRVVTAALRPTDIAHPQLIGRRGNTNYVTIEDFVPLYEAHDVLNPDPERNSV